MAVRKSTTPHSPKSKAPKAGKLTVAEIRQIPPHQWTPEQEAIISADHRARMAATRASMAQIAYGALVGTAITAAIRTHFNAWVIMDAFPDDDSRRPDQEKGFQAACSFEEEARTALLSLPVADRADLVVKGQYLELVEKIGALAGMEAHRLLIASLVAADDAPTAPMVFATDAVISDIPLDDASMFDLMRLHFDLAQFANAITSVIDPQPTYNLKRPDGLTDYNAIGKALTAVVDWCDVQRDRVDNEARTRKPATLTELEYRHALMMDYAVHDGFEAQTALIEEGIAFREAIRKAA